MVTDCGLSYFDQNMHTTLIILFAIVCQEVFGSVQLVHSPRYSKARSATSAASDPAINVEIYKQCVTSHDIYNTPNIAPVAAQFVPPQPPIFKQKYSETEFRKALYENRIQPMLEAAQVSQSQMPSANLC